MAAQIYLISKAESQKPVRALIDQVHAVIANSDDGGTDAVIIAEAVASAQALGFNLPADYFDTVEILGPPTAGIMTTDEDIIVLTDRSQARQIA